MTVKDLRELLAKYPPDAEVWYLEATYGELHTKVSAEDIGMRRGKLVLGYDGTGGGDVD